MKITKVMPNWELDNTAARYIGRKAVYRTYEKTVMVGTIERFDGTLAIIRFDDGRWAFSDHTLELVG